MKTIPKLFSTPMVQAFLDDRKTQTRRTKGLESVNNCVMQWEFVSFGKNPEYENDTRLFAYFKTGEDTWCYVLVPYVVGDILWVRETWAKTTNVEKVTEWLKNRPHYPIEEYEEGILWQAYVWRADGEMQWVDDEGFSTEKSYWKPSIHMPKAAARIFLKITKVRVEKLQAISECDAVAEGVENILPTGTFSYKSYVSKNGGSGVSSYVSFRTLWQSINGPESWDANPWVWVIEFEKCDKPENFI